MTDGNTIKISILR